MADDAWRDLIVGDRMRVDQQFAERVSESGFTNQEWSLIMTAVSFEVEDADGDPTLVADCSRVPDIVPELARLNQERGQYGGGGGGGSNGGGLFASIKSSLGLGGSSVDQETVENAERLTGQYATELENHLRDNGKWQRVVDLSADDEDQPSPE